MGWDSARPVPWQRLMREWLIYAAIMVAVLYLLFRGDVLGVVSGVLISGPLYLLIGYVLAKFGYQRKTLKELRTPRAEPRETTSTDSGTTSGPHTRPAPTRRTSTGPSNRPRSSKRKRR